MPRVSIGLPVYNGEEFIEFAINSILTQTFKDFELIISDNGSTDNTEKICRAYAKKDRRIRYYRNKKNRGAAWNFNRVFKLSKGTYFKWVAADEGIEPRFLEEAVSILDNDLTSILVNSKFIIHDEYKKRVVKRDYDYELQSPYARKRFYKLYAITPNPIYPIWGLIRSDVLKKTHLIRPFVNSDHCLVMELLLKGKFVQLPDFLTHLRTHPEAYHKISNKSSYVKGKAEARWFDPKNKSSIVLPQCKMIWEFFCLIIQSRESFWNKSIMSLYLFYLFGFKEYKILCKEFIFAFGLKKFYLWAKKSNIK